MDTAGIGGVEGSKAYLGGRADGLDVQVREEGRWRGRWWRKHCKGDTVGRLRAPLGAGRDFGQQCPVGRKALVPGMEKKSPN